MFYCADDGNWWHGTFAAKQLSWKLGAETYAKQDKSILDNLAYNVLLLAIDTHRTSRYNMKYT